MTRPSIDVVRPLALALPEVEQSQHFGTPDFRVRGKIFATARHDEALCMLKLPLHIQEAMVETHPDVFSLPPGGWAKHGSTYADTDKIDPDLLKDLLDLAWRRAAPKTLVAAHAPRSGPSPTLDDDMTETLGVSGTPGDPASPPPALQGGAPKGGPRKAALTFIFATALMDVTAIGIVIPVLPPLIKQFNHGNTAAAAGYVGLFGLIFASMQLIFSPVIGALSDRFGRRPVLLISIFGLGFDYLLMGVSPNIGWLFVGRLVSGITAASFSTAQAYIADVTPPDKRAANFGLMGTAFGIGFILGPTIAAVLAPLGPRMPFFAAAGLALINGLYGLIILPESLPKDRRAPFEIKNANPFGSLRLYASRPQLMGLAGVLFLFYLAQQVLQSTFVLYTSYRYGWGVSIMGIALALTGAASIVTQAFVVKPFVARFGERGALATGLCCGALGFFVYGSAAHAWQYWIGVPIFAGTGLIGPGMQGMMTRRVGPTEQGRLQGANSGVLAMAGLVGPILFTQVFAWSIRGAKAGGGLPGLAIWVAGAFLTVALLVTLSQPKAETLTPNPQNGEPTAA